METKTILQSERLLLRQFTPEDAQHFHDLNLDPAVIRFTGDPPFESVEAARQFLENYDQYERFGYGRWAVIHRQAGEWLGWCGLKFHPDTGETDLGYRFFQKHWGKGYATESALACLDFGFANLHLHRIVGRAMKDNPASIRVLEKIGMRYVQDFDFDGNPGVEYEIMK